MNTKSKKILITGGAGFIGSNSVDYFLKKGYQVTILDNFSRWGAEANVKWLKQNHKNKPFFVIKDDIRNIDILEKIVPGHDVVLHLAAQVAVTTSVINPREDFEINALGTLNVLEAARQSKNKPIIIFSSTNKVYGASEDVRIIETGNRYEYQDFPEGISELRLLDFHSPYGCSNGAADQYVRDYSRIYGLKTIVFRQSCIYGPRQFGVEDQGWVAWFIIATVLNKPLTIYGDGKQVRDVLFVDDLIRAYDMAFENINKTSGKIYNIGGGPNKTLYLLELIDYLEQIFGRKIGYSFSDWRPGDQKVYISDISKAKKDFGWSPKTSVKEGIERLADWVKENKDLF